MRKTKQGVKKQFLLKYEKNLTYYYTQNTQKIYMQMINFFAVIGKFSAGGLRSVTMFNKAPAYNRKYNL